MIPAATGPDVGVACPLCRRQGVAYFARHSKVAQEVYACGQCGLHFAHPHESYIPSVTDGMENPLDFKFWSTPEAETAYVRWRGAENTRIANVVRRDLPAQKPVRLLEIGFGTGPMTELLMGDVQEYWGLEPVPATCADTVQRLHLDPEKFVCAKAEDLDTHAAFRDLSNYFDVIVMVSVFEHVSRPADILTMCNRLLKRGGQLIVSTPDSSNFRLLRRLRRLARMEPWSYFHVSFFNPSGLEAAFTAAGFEVFRRDRGQLVTDDSVSYFGKLTGSALIPIAMRTFGALKLDQVLKIQTLFYVLKKI
jgi:SAM-dependent methyltransferase